MEQFILDAIAARVATLNQTSSKESVEEPPRLCWKGRVLVAQTPIPPEFDFNAFISDLREERIQELGSW